MSAHDSKRSKPTGSKRTRNSNKSANGPFAAAKEQTGNRGRASNRWEGWALSSTAALKGLRVLDLTRLLPGPVATLRLAEMGADVLKIEAPGAGDATRTMMQSSADRVAGRPGAFYRLGDRGKRETRLGPKTQRGR